MAEQILEWHPVSGITMPCAGVDIAEAAGKLSLVLLFSEVVGGEPRDLRLVFGRVAAFMSHEESAHPLNDNSREQPLLSGKWSKYTFPCLEVTRSDWLKSFGESRLLGFGECRHFRVVTLDKTVDVAARKEPTAQWLEPA